MERYAEFRAAKAERDGEGVVLPWGADEFVLVNEMDVAALEAVVGIDDAFASGSRVAIMRAIKAWLELACADGETFTRMWAKVRRDRLDIDQLNELAHHVHMAVIGVPLEQLPTLDGPSLPGGTLPKEDSSLPEPGPHPAEVGSPA